MTAQPTTSPTLVSSPDGRSFRLRTSADEGVRAGDYVTTADGTGGRAPRLRGGRGRGDRDHHLRRGLAASRTDHAGAVPDRVGATEHGGGDGGYVADAGATLPVGTLVDDPSVPVGLIPKRLNRYTFWCGQSGSGKTYALGVALEQILLHTRLHRRHRADALRPSAHDHVAALQFDQPGGTTQLRR